MPTNSSPRRLSSGPSAAQISRSRVGQLARFGGAAGGEVGADVALAGPAVDRAGDLALDQDDPLVAFRDLGKEGLEHVRLAIGGVEQFHQRREVGAVAADLEHRLAGIAVERLQRRRRHALRRNLRATPSERVSMVGGMNRAKSSTQTFSGALRTAAGIVDDQGLVLDPLEQMRRGDVAEVERRILAHQHDVDIAAEVEDRELAQPEMIARRPAGR